MWTPTPTAPYSARRHSTPWSGSGRPSGSPAAPASCRHHPVAGHHRADLPGGVGRGACAGRHWRLRRAGRCGHRSSIQVHPSRRVRAVPKEGRAERQEDRCPPGFFQSYAGTQPPWVYEQHFTTMKWVTNSLNKLRRLSLVFSFWDANSEHLRPIRKICKLPKMMDFKLVYFVELKKVPKGFDFAYIYSYSVLH